MTEEPDRRKVLGLFLAAPLAPLAAPPAQAPPAEPAFKTFAINDKAVDDIIAAWERAKVLG